MDELIKALRECEYCNVCSIAVDVDCPFGGRDALEIAAADAIERLTAEVDRKDKAIQGLLTQIEKLNESEHENG